MMTNDNEEWTTTYRSTKIPRRKVQYCAELIFLLRALSKSTHKFVAWYYTNVIYVMYEEWSLIEESACRFH